MISTGTARLSIGSEEETMARFSLWSDCIFEVMAMRCRLEKVNHIKGQRRFYELAIIHTLFGEWCLRRTWGRLGSPAGREMCQYFDCRDGAKAAFLQMKRKKSERGYGVIPVQLELFE